ncbi:hypothetical protein [Micavibrio aeruginosavorus]|uniref:hypothetical protein n=1 Tax=Micavibrio aeruginosavorus TaxID=349221 RepID=UPI003F4AD7DF
MEFASSIKTTTAAFLLASAATIGLNAPEAEAAPAQSDRMESCIKQTLNRVANPSPGLIASAEKACERQLQVQDHKNGAGEAPAQGQAPSASDRKGAQEKLNNRVEEICASGGKLANGKDISAMCKRMEMRKRMPQ